MYVVLYKLSRMRTHIQVYENHDEDYIGNLKELQLIRDLKREY